MFSIINKYTDLQDELKKLHSNYGKIPKWQFMLESVKLNDKMELLEGILKKTQGMKKEKKTSAEKVQENIISLKKSGIDPIELSKNINSIAFLVDIIEGRSKRVNEILRKSGNYKFADELYIKNIMHYSSFMQKSLSRILGLETAESFGDTCDFIDEVIGLVGDAKIEDQRMKILSTIKLIIK